MGEAGTPKPKAESWNSRLGVILAVAGSAVGLGNFLRFPGQAAGYGGGAFMIAYFVSLLLLGLPIAWAEWTMGRQGGRYGFNSCPAIFAMFTRRPWGRYFGVIGVIIPVVIYMYYINIEAWCLGYAWEFARGALHLTTKEAAGSFFENFVGQGADGAAFAHGFGEVGTFLVICFILNFFLIYRGLSKGIEFFCTYAMPTLVVIAIVILVRVLTLGTPDAARPYNNVDNGLGFMWNPSKVELQENVAPVGQPPEWQVQRELVGPRAVAEVRAEAKANPRIRIKEVTMWQQLRRPEMWLAAAGQIFFSLSVGFGVILTYSSYLKKDDDIVLSGLSAVAANEFCEVALGGLITLPAGIAFLGAAGVAGASTFGLGFNVLPMVFGSMPAGNLFGFLFFFLLFLAAITSSLSMLQPGIAFLEDAYRIDRKKSVAALGCITALGAVFVAWFSKDLKALDTIDFWVGTFLIFVLATIQIILFSWVRGVDEGLEDAHVGASIRIPRIYRFIMRWITPTFLIVVIVMWIYYDVLGGGGEVSGYIKDLTTHRNPVAMMSVALVIFVGLLITLVLTNRGFVTRLRDANKKEVDK